MNPSNWARILVFRTCSALKEVVFQWLHLEDQLAVSWAFRSRWPRGCVHQVGPSCGSLMFLTEAAGKGLPLCLPPQSHLRVKPNWKGVLFSSPPTRRAHGVRCCCRSVPATPHSSVPQFPHPCMGPPSHPPFALGALVEIGRVASNGAWHKVTTRWHYNIKVRQSSL